MGMIRTAGINQTMTAVVKNYINKHTRTAKQWHMVAF